MQQSMVIAFRPETTDECVYDEVWTRNCYRVDKFKPSDVVVDIGAHCGYFSSLCAERGAGTILAFELEMENVIIARDNLANYPQVKLSHLAVWKTTGRIDWHGMYMTADSLLKNTGSAHVLCAAGPHSDQRIGVQAITLDEILETIHSRVALVKMDCEGAEFEIVPATKSWAKVDRLVGEVHGYRKEYHVPDFYMEIKRHFPNLEVVSTCPEYGLETFFAWR